MTKKNTDLAVKLILALGAALLTVGALCATIRSNENRIEKVEVKTETNQGAIAELKTDVKYIVRAVDEIKAEVKK